MESVRGGCLVITHGEQSTVNFFQRNRGAKTLQNKIINKRIGNNCIKNLLVRNRRSKKKLKMSNKALFNCVVVINPVIMFIKEGLYPITPSSNKSFFDGNSAYCDHQAESTWIGLVETKRPLHDPIRSCIGSKDPARGVQAAHLDLQGAFYLFLQCDPKGAFFSKTNFHKPPSSK